MSLGTHNAVRQRKLNHFFSFGHFLVSVATPAEPRGEKKLSFVQILGGEKLLKFGGKCR